MKNKIITFSFLSFILFFSILHIIIPDSKVSYSERRKLASFPKIEFTNKYINKVDKYFLDNFPFRDSFRSIKALFNYKVLRRLDNNKIYLKDNYIFKSNYPTNFDSINNFINKTNEVRKMFTKDNKEYMMIIPDKNYYLHDSNFLQIDYDFLYRELDKLDVNKIDIRDIMTLEDYYETDTHWKQEKLDKVIKRMSNSLSFNYDNIYYKENVYDKFYGVYYGESAINRKPENITYLTNSTLDKAKVKYLENDELTSIYNISNLSSLDSYEVFLDGASSFIEIYNESSKSPKELVIFRDSFGSSLTPLLVNYYSKITLIDNRYINTTHLKNYINFKDQDILFLYSTLIVNNSGTLKG